MTPSKSDRAQLEDLVLQMMETELGGEKIYRAAIATAVNGSLKEEWQGYLKETLHHQDVVRGLCATLGLNADQQSPTRTVVHHIGKSLVQAIEMAQRNALPADRAGRSRRCGAGQDQGPLQLGAARACRRSRDRRHGRAFRAAHEDVEQRRPPPFPHQGLDARAGHSGPGHAGGAAACSGGSETSRDRDWRFACGASAHSSML